MLSYFFYICFMSVLNRCVFLICNLGLLCTVQAVAQDLCEDSSAVCITNAFTPNGDGFNDAWVIKNLQQYPNTSVQVFTSNGKPVYSNTNYQNTWQGTNDDGETLPAGPYYYVLVLGGDGEKYTGVVVIIRDS